MCGAVWCLLFLLLCRGSLEMVVEDQASQSRWHTYKLEKGQNILKNLKRHSDGTFTSDFTRYLDKIKAKDFVQWLARTKHEGCSDPPQIEVV